MSKGWRAVIAWPLAYGCFWTGDFVSRLAELGDGWFGRFYPLYNRLMLWSLRLNDWGGLRLWK
jgi:hypothetical protein